MVLEKFRNRVKFYSIAGTSDGFGGSSGDTQTLQATVWGRVERMKGLEALQLEQILNSIPYLITIRGQALPSGFTLDNYRIEADGVLFNIHSKYRDEYNRFLKLICWSSESEL